MAETHNFTACFTLESVGWTEHCAALGCCTLLLGPSATVPRAFSRITARCCHMPLENKVDIFAGCHIDSLQADRARNDAMITTCRFSARVGAIASVLKA